MNESINRLIMQQSEESSYSSTIIKVAMSQICQSIGFQAAESSALNTITDIAIRYLKAIAKSASSSAISLNKTQCNVFDIVVALEELGSVVGFQGGSDMSVECVLSSSVLVDLERFVIFSDEIPFAKALGRGRRGEDGGVNGVLKDGVKDNYVPFANSLGRRGCGGDCVGLICGKKDGVIDDDVKANDVPLVKALGRGGFGGGGDCAGLVCGKKCGVVDDEGDGVVNAKALARRRVCGAGDCDCVGLVCLNKGGVVVDDVVKVKHVPRWLPEMPVICMEKEGEEEGRWEEGWKCCGNKEREEKENMGFELSGKRGEVKERVRKGTRGGVSRSGGCGKRVLCRNDWKGGNGGVEKKRVMVSFKKRLK